MLLETMMSCKAHKLCFKLLGIQLQGPLAQSLGKWLHFIKLVFVVPMASQQSEPCAMGTHMQFDASQLN